VNAAEKPSPLLVSIDMGYGHMRPAHALADRLGVEILEADRPPLADDEEQRLWRVTRDFYEGATRASQWPVIGAPLRLFLDAVTEIPSLYPNRDLSKPTAAVRGLSHMIKRGIGRGLVERLRGSEAPLLTTFYTPAVIADGRVENEIYCVVTDADINRVWASANSRHTRIRYLVPSARAWRRLRSYGVPESRIDFTGFPLPHELLGGRDLPVLRRNVAARLARLDPRGRFRKEAANEIEHFLGALPSEEEGRPPLLTFAVGGTGTQNELVERFLPSLARPLNTGRLRLALVAGVRAELVERFRDWLDRADVAEETVEILYGEDFPTYVKAFNQLLARTDILWTKPSEMTFFGALGLPLVFTWPVGMHERYNRRWAIENGAGLKQHDPRFVGDWISDWLNDGTLAAACWSGFQRLPKFGLYRILDALESGAAAALAGGDSPRYQVRHA
jgi:hypothetical protein